MMAVFKMPGFLDAYQLGIEVGKDKSSRLCLCFRKGSVALKTVRIIETDDKSLSKIRKDIAICKRLKHANIVEFLDIYTPYGPGQDTYLVYDIIAGADLFYDITRKDYNENLAANCFRQILEGVAYMHNSDIIHRDLRPENILVSHEGNLSVKISNFSSAVGLGKGESFNQQVFEISSYTTPEEIMELPLGNPIDLWACGILFYLMSVGKLPFEGDRDELSSNIKSVSFSWLSQREDNEISDETKDMIKKFLVVDPQTRITADEALLDTYLLSRQSSQESASEPTANLPSATEDEAKAKPKSKAARVIKALGKMVAFTRRKRSSSSQVPVQKPKPIPESMRVRSMDDLYRLAAMRYRSRYLTECDEAEQSGQSSSSRGEAKASDGKKESEGATPTTGQPESEQIKEGCQESTARNAPAASEGTTPDKSDSTVPTSLESSVTRSTSALTIESESQSKSPEQAKESNVCGEACNLAKPSDEPGVQHDDDAQIVSPSAQKIVPRSYRAPKLKHLGRSRAASDEDAICVSDVVSEDAE